MNNQFMTFDQESALKCGSPSSLREGGAKIVTIESAFYIQAKTGSHGIEFSGKTSDGLKVSFLKVYYMKQDNSVIYSGKSILDAIMGFLNIPSLSFSEVRIGNEMKNMVPELKGRTVGMFLQKDIYTKSNNEDGYSFKIEAVFDKISNKTYKELSENLPAQSIGRMANSYKDNDTRELAQRGQPQAHAATVASSSPGLHSGNLDHFDDDIPFN